MRVYKTRHSLVRIQLDVEELSAGLERPEKQARQGPAEPIELELLQGPGARVFHPDRARAGIDAPEADVLMTIVSGNTRDMPGSVEVIPAAQEVLRPGKQHSKNLLRKTALVDEQVRQKGAGFRSEEHTSELQS